MYHYAILKCKQNQRAAARLPGQSRRLFSTEPPESGATMITCTFTSENPSRTASLGQSIGERLAAGSVIALTGELGCGKTLFTRGICQGLDVPLRLVNSPTFVLVNEYQGRLPVFHLDLYRLSTGDDVMELGLADYFTRTAEGVMIIEWAEKIYDLLPIDRLLVEFERLSARRRLITMSARGRRFAGILKELDGS